MTEGTKNVGRRWKQILTAGVLAALFAYLAREHHRLTEINASSTQHASQAEINELQGSVDRLQAQLESILQQPAAVTVDRFDKANEQLIAKLADVERTAQLAAPADAIKSFDDQVRSLTEQIAKIRRVSAPPRTATDGDRTVHPVPAAATIPDPPFTPLTIESRGGEQFLVVVPTGSRSVSDARLLRVGDTEQGWLLQRIGARVAEFRIEGQLRQITLP